jgi:hypothetical protein
MKHLRVVANQRHSRQPLVKHLRGEAHTRQRWLLM